MCIKVSACLLYMIFLSRFTKVIQKIKYVAYLNSLFIQSIYCQYCLLQIGSKKPRTELNGMSTNNGDQFLSPSAMSSLTHSHLYGRLPPTMVDNPLLPTKGSNAAVHEPYHPYKQIGQSLPTINRQSTKQQIIIQEFLNGSHAGSYHQQQLQQLPSGSGGSHSSTLNNSSITILTSHQSSSPTNSVSEQSTQSTVVLDRINICINNHFNEPQHQQQQVDVAKSSVNEKRSSVDLEPDSTTSSLGQLPVTPEKNSTKFKLQEDVLVENKDGRFYLGTIIAIGSGQCLVRFNDNTESWSDFRELTKLSSNETDDTPVCVVCKRHNADDCAEVCENCGRGYHIKCMDGNFERNGYWFCRM